MTERGMLFSAPMVRALIAKRKRVTRRLNTPRYKPPAKGDLIWVRETWQAWKQTSYEYDEWEALTREVRGCTWAEYVAECGQPSCIEYRATSKSGGPWTPAIHMPRWAARLTGICASVRLERLHEIDDADAVLEGVVAGNIPADENGPRRIGYVLGDDDGECTLYPTERMAFSFGWDTINADRAPWASNPEVWRIEIEEVACRT